MSEEQQSVSSEQPTSDSQTLDQVYEKFNVEETARSFSPQQQHQQPTAQPAPTAPPMGTDIPDPIMDAAGFKAYLAKNHSAHAQALAHLTQTQQQLAVGEIRRKNEADVKSAVSQIRDKLGQDVDDEFIEVQLDYKSRKDPRFMSLFQNRDKNPAAWRAALNAVGNELKQKNQFKSDPQIAENVRAAKKSTESSLTSRNQDDGANPIEKRLQNAKTPAEFDQEWRRMMG